MTGRRCGGGGRSYMEPVKILPERELKTLFFIYLSPLLLPVLILLAVIIFAPLDFPATVILPALTVLLLVLAGLIALWIPAFWRTLEYVIEEDMLRESSGVFWKKRVIVPYGKVTNVNIVQGPFQRLYGLGSIHIQTAGSGGAQGARPEMSLLGIRDLEGTRDIIMARVKARSAAAPSAPAPAGAEKDDQRDVQGRMLEELKAIRAALERK